MHLGFDTRVVAGEAGEGVHVHTDLLVDEVDVFPRDIVKPLFRVPGWLLHGGLRHGP